jgi:hypothetical protein
MAYAGRDFSPVEQAESLIYGLDFVNDMREGEALTGAVWEVIVRDGIDPDPNSHLVGDPVLVVPEGTTMQTATTQRIEGLLPDVTYTVRAVVTTSMDNKLSLWSHIQGEPVE